MRHAKRDEKMFSLSLTTFRYTVMSGTPEKILEHLLATIKLDSNGNDPAGGSLHTLSAVFLCLETGSDCDACLPADSFVIDFLLTHKVFMPSSQLCPALQHQYPLMV